MTTAAIIVAAGRGTRAGGDMPKQWQMLGGRPVLAHTLAAFQKHVNIDHIVLVIHPDDTARTDDITAQIVTGGATRQASVSAGLAAIAGQFDHVLIHDAARPFVTEAVIDRVLATLQTHQAAAPAVPVVDTLWQGRDGHVTGLTPRDGLFRAQTPQGFHLDALLKAHATADASATDDVAVAQAAGLTVAIVEGDPDNMKITSPDDMTRAEKRMGQTMDIRTGNGYDVHRFGAGDHVWLCGVKVEHDRSLQGHSDADVGMHAITDAIYGALGAGDIGQHFPPSDAQWKGAKSDIFLRHAVDLATSRGFKISNVDCTLVCEYPKIGPHQNAMKEALCHIMSLPVDRISVKATTSEQLGFTGRREGIAAIATTTLVKP